MPHKSLDPIEEAGFGDLPEAHPASGTLSIVGVTDARVTPVTPPGDPGHRQNKSCESEMKRRR